MIDFTYLTEIHPFLSLSFSLILFLGLYAIGEVIFSNKQIQLIFVNISEFKYQNILVAVNLLMFVLFPIVLFFPYSKIILNFFSIIIFIFGVYKIFALTKKKFLIKIEKINFERVLFLFIIVGFFLITFSPVNHADSLDYHMGGALHIFKTGKLPNTLENFHNLLVGAGEIFYSIGFFFGAEQFGTLIQFSGLLSLIGIVKKLKNKNSTFFILLILSSPILIFLSSSPKPQLFQICSNTIIFVILFINFFSTEKYKIINFSLILIVNVFLINSINAKFSFILSSFILYVLLFFFSYKQKCLLKTILLSSIFLFFFYLNFPYWKFITWGGNFLHYLIDPFPDHLEGVKFFKSYLINYKRESSIIYLIFPKSLGQFTDVLGIGCLIYVYFFLKKEICFIYFFPIFLLFILINYFFGQPSGRFFIEPYIWSVLLIASVNRINIPMKFRILFYPQFLLAILAIWYGVFAMSYGFINTNLRNQVMSNTANGYSLFKWSNSIINKEDTVISMHRSITLGKSKTLSTNFLYYVSSRTNDSYYLKNIISNKNLVGSTYLLTYGNKTNVGVFSNCIDSLYKEKKDAGRQVGRNPFNKASFYDGYLFKMKDIQKSNCLKSTN